MHYARLANTLLKTKKVHETIHISDWHHFSDIHISQGSVATRLRRGGIFKYKFVANLLQSPSLKKVWKLVNIWWSYGQEFGVFFWFTAYIPSHLKYVATLACEIWMSVKKGGNLKYVLWLIVSYAQFALQFCPQRCITRQINKITFVLQTETVTNCCYVNRQINVSLSTNIKLL